MTLKYIDAVAVCVNPTFDTGYGSLKHQVMTFKMLTTDIAAANGKAEANRVT